ncbi:MAG: GNAT family N-acetyltransferase [Bacteroidetes bacterium]|nr:GNAT family N-acetyltransferase [Bacteroidota bacterium]
MEIIHLKWDTDFFGYNVGKVLLEDNCLNEEILRNNDYRLLYIYSNVVLEKEVLLKYNLFLADEKTDLITHVSDLTFDKSVNESIKELLSVDQNLLDLTYQSGHYSRFKIDPNFKNNEFENLYSSWIEQSINHSIAEKVLGFVVNDKTVGFITIAFKNNAYDIGLIAVDAVYRSMKIGKQLLEYVFNYALSKKVNTITVTTQMQNQGALNFYLQNGFSVNRSTFIYHLWK